MTVRGYVWLVLLGALALAGFAPSGRAQTPSTEALFKAAYLHKFGLYTVWPENNPAVPPKEFVIGVLGKDNFDGGLDKMVQVQKEVYGKKIVIQRFASMNNYKPCNILYVSSQPAANANETTADRLAAALKQLKSDPVLIVGDTEGLIQKGAMINLYLAKDNTMKYEINPAAFKQVGLHPKADLLKYGTIVTPKTKE